MKFSFLHTIKRVRKIIPANYKKTSRYFFILSLVLLFLDFFSVFLLIPLMLSVLNNSASISFMPLNFLNTINSFTLVIIVVVFFIIKNFIAIHINKYQAQVAYSLSSEYSSLISKHYILGNYLNFKKQKKSTLIKEIIFVSNDFVGNVLLSINTIITELSLLLLLFAIGLYFYFFTTLFTVLFIGLIMLVTHYYNRQSINEINKTRSHDYDKNISNLTNLLNGFMSIKSPDLMEHFLDTFYQSNKKLNQNYAVLNAKKINNSKQTEILMVLLLCGVFSITQFSAFSEINMVVFLSIFGALIFKMIPSINKLNIALTNFNAHKYSLDILEKKYSEIKIIDTQKQAIVFNTGIKLENISFSFKKGKPLFTKLNTTIQKGDFVAITGVSGVGKTTLLNIISKLIDPTAGNIYVDDTKITKTNKYNYFKLITYLVQKPFIYEGTILDNLLLKKRNYQPNELNKILDSLELLDTIEQLPNKLDAYIGNEGNNLSGGQLQRLCIARALLYQPEILILDEATNNLDKETETKVLIYLKEYAKITNTTIISVSHHIEDTKHLFNHIIPLD